MRAQWLQWEQRWLAFSRRERVLLLATAIVVPLLGAYVYILEPALIGLQALEKQIDSKQRTVADLELVLRTLESRNLPDPNSKARQELEALLQRLSSVNREVTDLSEGLVGPQEMLGLLYSVLDTGRGLKVVTARSLEVEPLKLELSKHAASKAAPEKGAPEKGAQAADVDETPVYLHPFELELEGSYQQLYSYLLGLEALHSGFFWGELDFSIAEHPRAKIRLKVYTLSTSERWLGA